MARTNSNYSILVDVELETSSIKKQLNQAAQDVKLNLDTKGAVSGLDSLNGAMEDTSLTFQAANEVFSKSIEVIGSMVNQVYELDTALTEFRKVSDLSGSALDSYVDKLNTMGGAVARTGSEMVEAATEFRKNGFNDEDAAQLGQVAAMYQNISDEAISAGDSANFIIAQLVAFGDQMTQFNSEAEKATHIINSVNEVSNSFAVSSADLAGSIGNVSSALSVGGNSFEEVLGLIY